MESREERRSSSGIRARRFRVGRRGRDPPAARDLQTPSCDQRTGTSAERSQPCACAVWWFTFPDEVKTHVVPALEFPARPEAVASLPRRVPPPPGSSPRPLWTCGPHGKAARFLLAPRIHVQLASFIMLQELRLLSCKLFHPVHMISDHQKDIYVQKNGKQHKFIVGSDFGKMSPKSPTICTQPQPIPRPRGSGDPPLCAPTSSASACRGPYSHVFSVALSPVGLQSRGTGPEMCLLRTRCGAGSEEHPDV